MKTYIKREHYLNKIRPFIGKGLIKILTGQRRVGKSYLLFQIMDEIKKTAPSANFIYINKELYEFDRLKNYKDLLQYVDSKLVKGVKNCLFIDEIQEIANFEKALRDWQARGECDIYCTGSNAFLLSGEIATRLGGRFKEISVHSLSYPEFLEFHRLDKGRESLEKYIKYGGLPYLINLDMQDEIIYGYLGDIYNSIILKDVVSRFSVRHVNLLKRLVEYLADNVGSLFSAKKVSDFLKSQRVNISPNTILNYLSYLSSSFFIHPVARSAVAGKKIFEINEKYYFEDLGIRHALIGYHQRDIGKILENLVFSHLQFLGYKISVGQLGNNREIDFIAENSRGKIYVQAAYLLHSQQAREREFGNLSAISDNYPKFVVSLDEFSGGEEKGIKQMHILDFLTRMDFE